MTIASINPVTGKIEWTHDPMTDQEIDERIDLAHRAFSSYRLTGFSERAQWMRSAADILDREGHELACTITREMGKTITAARAEVAKCVKLCLFYAEHAERFLADEVADPHAVGATCAYTRYQPLGPILAIMPWNFPLWQVMRFAVPALMAGNVGLLKHASTVPVTALYIESLFSRAGFPSGVFTTLLVGSGAVEPILRDSRIKAVTLTGSTSAGRSVASIAGSEIKPVVLELGGSDPFIVMPSADLGQAARIGVISRTLTNGQSCIAAKRFIVHREVLGEFQRLFVDLMSGLRVGDPMDESTEIGPLATQAQRDGVAELVDDAVGKGATILCGGKSLEGPGFYYPPTVLTDITENMRMYHDEVFGPVAQIFPVDSLQEAIALANATEFGLGANVWTHHHGEAEQCIRDIEAGGVFINGMTASYPELPFGGVKTSGYGRELAAHGIREFCNIKTVWIRMDPSKSH